MQNNMLVNFDFLLKVFDSIPSPIFIVDSDVRIYHFNPAAAAAFGPDFSKVYLKRGGEVLHCLHVADHPQGCGYSDFCETCVIRNSVVSAYEHKKILRERTRLEIQDGEKKTETDLLITASPFEFNGKTYVLLILADVTELDELRGLLPICSNCKSIRNDDHYWESVEKYFSTHHDITFTHGVCPKCAQEFYWSSKKK